MNIHIHCLAVHSCGHTRQHSAECSLAFVKTMQEYNQSFLCIVLRATCQSEPSTLSFLVLIHRYVLSIAGSIYVSPPPINGKPWSLTHPTSQPKHKLPISMATRSDTARVNTGRKFNERIHPAIRTFFRSVQLDGAHCRDNQPHPNAHKGTEPSSYLSQIGMRK